MNFTLHVWRQKNAQDKGRMVTYQAKDIPSSASFLEMLDLVNEGLVTKGEEPIAFDHDCREGICGMCSLMINGCAHGPETHNTTCQLHMRSFKDGDEIFIEPFRARAFPVVKDLVTDRSALDRIMASGGFVSVNTGGAQDANALPIAKKKAEVAFEAAACIGCGACVASCKNASAMLYVSAKVSHLANLPQGDAERHDRALNMISAMDKEGFGACSNQYECEAACPKGISVKFIAQTYREYFKGTLKEGE